MSQNHDFNSNFSDDVDTTIYHFASEVRNVCFTWLDGRRMFFNYAYLVSVELDFQKPENCLVVCFTSHRVILHGYNLTTLFDLFMRHIPKVISETHSRYATDGQQKPVVIRITVKE